jgi:hypothetical protein
MWLFPVLCKNIPRNSTVNPKIAIKPVNMQIKAKLNFVYDIQVVWNMFVFYFECSRMNQEKYAFARTSEPC